MQVNILFTVKWQFKTAPWYKVTTCKKIVNCQKNKFVKSTQSGAVMVTVLPGVLLQNQN